ncbi:hypothetical protein C1Y31_04000 [Pseudomonas sp. FW305-25]|uniref:Uncharacterized protein n=1 Tax=Pseudomonas chlororaphis TaxID=587753 RepID=A0AB34CF82_9PSED|nr:hypothetical protein F2A38_02050 [Pseudomonas chlororaphis]PMY43635.1 hypothetical protein C1Y35_00640 [Pseudomonas sp. GW456-L14]PMY58399.1 hypothetical protein C1Y34_04625 [Pseudomonas sp. GW456-L12]PMY69391.1 hypothetical protein C1Y31_04000 [Pseudomonas sp. FW305-25]PNA80961.1 hypothetical protein C1Y33_08905 [Pseudomonas sp. FW305-76]
MDNFMEQPTYKMNRGAILTQGERCLVLPLHEYSRSPQTVHLLSKSAMSRSVAQASPTVSVSISQSGSSGAS